MGEQVTTQAHLTIVDSTDIESMTVEYARNQSTSTPPDASTGGWSTTRPAWAQGYYIWQRVRIHKTDTAASTDTFSTAVCLTGSAGTNSYTHVRYGTNSSGAGMTATPTASTTYIGIYTGTSATAPTSASSYTWSKYIGDTGYSLLTTLLRNNYTEAQWSGTYGLIGHTDTWVNGDNTQATGKIPYPTRVGDLFEVIGTATDSGNAWVATYQITSSVSSGGVPAKCIGSRKSLKGATGQTGPTGPTGPEAVVTITPSNINWDANNGNGSATLTAVLRVNGTVTTPTAYKWTKGTDTTSLGTSSTLNVSDLNATYNCTVTW